MDPLISTETIFYGTASNDGKKVGLPKYIVTFHIFFLQPGEHIYRPSTKLREGNVFTMMHGTSLHRATPGPAPRHGTPQPLLPPDIRHGTPPCPLLLTCGGHHWRPFQTCSPEDPLSPLVLTSAIEACMVGKRMVRILLECFLVSIIELTQRLLAS